MDGVYIIGTYNYITTCTEDSVGIITLNRPPVNVINREMTLEYHKALKAADADAHVKVIVLNGAGKGLSGGVDIKFMENFSSAEMREFLSLFYLETFRICRALSKPIIASIHGYAREGACTLSMACDIVIADEDSDFGYPGVPIIGAPPGMHVWFLQRLVGRMKAAELIFTGKSIGAKEAEKAGLITRSVPKGLLHKETMKLAKEIASMSPVALKIARDFMYDCEDMTFTEVPEAALNVVSNAFDLPHSKEARRAFLEKRKRVLGRIK